MSAEQPIGHDMDRTSQEVLDAGMAVRREVLGDAHVDRAEARKDATTEDFQNLITRYAWGTIWTRPATGCCCWDASRRARRSLRS